MVYGLTAYPLLEPDEGRNAEVAREMAASNDYLLPHLDGLPYVDKPVLFFAAEAATMELLGPGVLAARLPPLLFTLATLGVIAWFARRRSGSDAAWTAVIATGAAPLTLGFARTVIFDSALTLFVVIALVAFYEATERRYGGKVVSPDGEPLTAFPPSRLTAREGWAWAVGGWAATALAVLTKGPIGLALPLMVAIPYALWRRAGRVLWTAAGPLLFAALLMPWLMVMSRRVPGFLHYAVVTETLVRLTTPALGRTGPFWYFVPILLAGALPWTVVGLTGAKRALSPQDGGRRDPYAVFLLCWILVPLAFFSLSQSKRPQYIPPLVPAVALLVAHVWRAAERPAGARAAGVALIAAGAALGVAPWLLPHALPLSTAVRDTLPRTAAWLGSIAAVAGVVTLAFRARRDLVLLALALPVAAVPLAGTRLMREIGRERSSEDLALAIARVQSGESDVAAIGTFPLSLPFYLRRPILLASATGAELTSNYLSRHVDLWRLAADSPLRPADWWLEAAKRCGRATVFITRSGDAPTRAVLAAQVPLLIETRKYAAYGPCVGSDLASENVNRAVGQTASTLRD